ncbi:hypothetical protein M426DRAFT_315977 [Hypoxylon sp. CI-4A]|nr:hypothetical protein M426DRAFT_315977 [Hypoxylon sp. CI-4A]
MELTGFLTGQSWATYASYLVATWVGYHVFIILYNLSPFHPLSHIPGYWLARASYLPEFYYDMIKYGQYTKQIQKMHEKYGPLIRISPDEIHCNDINFVDEVYAGGNRKRNKPLHLISGSAHADSAFGTMDHDLHRLRRGPVAKFFSRSMISRLEGDIHRLAHQLCDKLLVNVQAPVDLAVAYSCFTTDAISAYCFGESFGFLDQEGWSPNFHVAEVAVLKPVFVLRFFPSLKMLFGLSKYFINYLPEDVSLLLRSLEIDLPNLVRKTQAEIDSGVIRDRPTIFDSLLQLSPKEKAPLNLKHEAVALIGAGTITTSWTLAVITYHLLNQPDTLEKLTKELKDNVKDLRELPNLSALENLPYLQGVIQEGFRLSYGVSGRSGRVATEEDLIYDGEWKEKKIAYVIPRGYAVGMSCIISHHNEDVFPDSHKFIPERWLDGEKKRDLDRAMFTFSKGSRSCLGMNLAICEVYVALAALTLRVFPQMRLFETTEEDVLYDYDMFIPMPKAGTQVQVTIEPS